jgi:arogenate dehydrogenase (NADP+)
VTAWRSGHLIVFTREGHEGYCIVEIGCAEHDVHAVETQLLTHTIGGMLALHHLHAK